MDHFLSHKLWLLPLICLLWQQCHGESRHHAARRHHHTSNVTISFPIPSSEYIRLHRRNATTLNHRFIWREQSTSCSVTCGIGVAGVNYRCYSPMTGKFVPDVKCDFKRRPLTVKRSCKLSDCEPRWEVGLWENCSVHCGLGVVQRPVTCVRYGVALSPVGQSFEELPDYYCIRNGDPKPVDEKACHQPKCSHWRVGPWSSCSSSCSSGIQTRQVRCMRKLPRREPCDHLLKPPSTKPCNYADLLQPDESCILSSKISTEARLGGSYAQQRPELLIRIQPHSLKPRYHVGDWGRCSRSCGPKPGIKYRVVQCRRYFPELRLHADVPDWECEGQHRPSCVENCYQHYSNCGNSNDEPSNEDELLSYQAFEWMETGFSTCSVSCGGGYRKNLILCFGITETSQVPVEDYHCANLPRPMEKYELCATETCLPEWRIVNKSSCSVTCGTGVQFQTSICIRRQPDVGLDEEVPDFMCQPFEKPPVALTCNAGPCNPQWKPSHWSDCSETCGVGWQVRNLTCILPIRVGYYETIANAICEDFMQQLQQQHYPITTRRCVALGKCAEIKALADDSTHVYLSDKAEITHFVGGNIYATPSLHSTLTLICPTLPNATVEWFKDGEPIVHQWMATRPSAMASALFHTKSLSSNTSGLYYCSARLDETQTATNFTSNVTILEQGDIIQLFGLNTSTVFNWKRVDPVILDGANNESNIRSRFNLMTAAAWNKKFEVSLYLSEKCLLDHSNKCSTFGRCSVGCAIRRSNEDEFVFTSPLSFIDKTICNELEEAYSEQLKALSKIKQPALLPVPFSKSCLDKLNPTWTIHKTGNCDTKRCLSNLGVAYADLSIRCQLLNRPVELENLFLDESYCATNERPLDYTFCLAPECSK